jgi:ABC-2 type transport system permease protein
MVMALLFSSIIVLALFALGVTLGGVHLPLGTAAALFATLVAGSVTFSALGLAIGYFATAQAAAPTVNLIYLPLSFLSGLWTPIWALPKSVQTLALVLPPYHLSQLALKTLNASRGGSVVTHVLALAIATALFLGIAAIGFKRDEKATM